MKILLDVHTHTVASGHAFSTLQEMVRTAADKGLQILGITEHTGGIPGTCSPIYFRNLPVVPRLMYGVELLLGAEINIVDYEGSLDLEEEYFKFLDIRIAGLHSLCYRPGTVEQNTLAVEGAIRNGHIDIISHPGETTVLSINIAIRRKREKIIWKSCVCANTMSNLSFWGVMPISLFPSPITDGCILCWWRPSFPKSLFSMISPMCSKLD